MQYKTLGNTGLLVSILSLGTMTFSGKGFYRAIGALDQAGADELVKAAIEGGITSSTRPTPTRRARANARSDNPSRT